MKHSMYQARFHTRLPSHNDGLVETDLWCLNSNAYITATFEEAGGQQVNELKIRQHHRDLRPLLSLTRTQPCDRSQISFTKIQDTVNIIEDTYSNPPSSTTPKLFIKSHFLEHGRKCWDTQKRNGTSQLWSRAILLYTCCLFPSVRLYSGLGGVI